MKQFAWFKNWPHKLRAQNSPDELHAEGLTNALRKQKTKRTPTSENLIDYLKTQNLNAPLETAKVLVTKYVTQLAKKKFSLNQLCYRTCLVWCTLLWETLQRRHSRHQAERGTSYVYCYLTVSITTSGKRLVLTAVPLQSIDDL